MSSHGQHVAALVGASITTVLGVLGTACLWAAHGPAGILGDWAFLALLGPPVALVGLATLCAALWHWSLRGVVLVIGLLMLAAGADPWLYTPALMHDRPGGAAAGMIGTLIFLFVGIPGVVITTIGVGLVLSEPQSLGRPQSASQDAAGTAQ
jgi:hypothetical protein